MQSSYIHSTSRALIAHVASIEFPRQIKQNEFFGALNSDSNPFRVRHVPGNGSSESSEPFLSKRLKTPKKALAFGPFGICLIAFSTILRYNKPVVKALLLTIQNTGARGKQKRYSKK